MTFAQALTEAVKAVPDTLLVASHPRVGHRDRRRGRAEEALERLKNIFGRIESSWRPASAEEGFEIVRRRLFQPITEPAALRRARRRRARPSRTCTATHSAGVPVRRAARASTSAGIEAAYPIHPELFDRLYNDWSTLDKFQRTRGVLRLMAAVIHALWERQDSQPADHARQHPDRRAARAVRADPLPRGQLGAGHREATSTARTRCPSRLDRENPNLGRYSAARRVARTIYIGSAPTLKAANAGLDDRQIKLGCVQPGETPATFGDALRRLTDQATYPLRGRPALLVSPPSPASLAWPTTAPGSFGGRCVPGDPQALAGADPHPRRLRQGARLPQLTPRRARRARRPPGHTRPRPRPT